MELILKTLILSHFHSKPWLRPSQDPYKFFRFWKPKALFGPLSIFRSWKIPDISRFTCLHSNENGVGDDQDSSNGFKSAAWPRWRAPSKHLFTTGVPAAVKELRTQADSAVSGREDISDWVLTKHTAVFSQVQTHDATQGTVLRYYGTHKEHQNDCKQLEQYTAWMSQWNPKGAQVHRCYTTYANPAAR